MLPFNVHVLGCGSAKPTLRHNHSGQIVDIHDKLFLVDCGEGMQIEFCRQHIGFSRMNHIFISHLHGDHCFGLPGLLTTMAMLGVRGEIHIYAIPEFEHLFGPLLSYYLRGADLKPVFHSVSPKGNETVYEDNSVTVTTLRLHHRVPCIGFVFREKPLLPHIRRDMIDFLGIPHYAINGIKEGGGWTTEEGKFYPHERLVVPNNPPRTYAYLSDTLPCPEHIEALRGIDLLYHESTFAEDKRARAYETGHSTASQAATFARDAGVKQLLIGHFSARYNDETVMLQEARAIFPNTILANEGLKVELLPSQDK